MGRGASSFPFALGYEFPHQGVGLYAAGEGRCDADMEVEAFALLCSEGYHCVGLVFQQTLCELPEVFRFREGDGLDEGLSVGCFLPLGV